MAKALQHLVDSIVAVTSGLPDPATLAGWQPALSGDIDIVIRRDGVWIHEGAPIQREGLVRLFASLLRRESDAEYYLVTPAEKWRLQVEAHPLIAVDCDRESAAATAGAPRWYVLLNTGGRCYLGGARTLHVDQQAEQDPYVDLPNGLTARLSRAAWYRLIDAATIERDRAYIMSGDEMIDLGSTL